MSDTSRRNFMSIAGVGTAAGIAVAVAPGSAGATAPPEQARPATLPATAEGAVAAYVDDVHSGQITLMVSGHEVTVTDRDLVARIARAYAKAARAAR